MSCVLIFSCIMTVITNFLVILVIAIVFAYVTEFLFFVFFLFLCQKKHFLFLIVDYFCCVVWYCFVVWFFKFVQNAFIESWPPLKSCLFLLLSSEECVNIEQLYIVCLFIFGVTNSVGSLSHADIFFFWGKIPCLHRKQLQSCELALVIANFPLHWRILSFWLKVWMKALLKNKLP